jgi:serine/threonine-protein kinase Chk2
LFLAPEILVTRGEGSYTNKVDVWSLGVILYICLVGYPPFSESSDLPPLTEQILKGLYTFPDEFWSEVSEAAKDLIRKMMCVDSDKRLTMTSVLEHPWLADDHDNTSRVENILHPTSPMIKSNKRSAFAEENAMEEDEDTTATESNSNGRTKRVKH